MGMFDTYLPSKKLNEVIKKELGVDEPDAHFQTKSLDLSLMFIEIGDDLKLKVEQTCHGYGDEYYNIIRTESLDGSDDPFVSQGGQLVFNFKGSRLEAILYHPKGIMFRKPEDYVGLKLIEFGNSVDDYKVIDVRPDNKDAVFTAKNIMDELSEL